VEWNILTAERRLDFSFGRWVMKSFVPLSCALAVLSLIQIAAAKPAPTFRNVDLNAFNGICASMDATHVLCRLTETGKQSGSNAHWGPWYQIGSGQAPNGWSLERTEFHGTAVAQQGEENHRCGGSDDSPVVNGFKQGTSYWFQCILIERDNFHALWQYSIQGNRNGSLQGDVELISIYVPAGP
jgi:hypothetical protein